MLQMNKKFSPIHVVSASAGTGKTFRLASEYSKFLSGEPNSNLPLSSQIFAATFTNKAASELVHRIRKFLLKAGHWDKAQSLFVAPIGTVNSVCGRLVADLAIQAGLSPSVRVIAEEQQADIFYFAVEEVLDTYAGRLWPLLYRMKKLEDSRSKLDSWRDDVIRVVDLARQNNIEPEHLTKYGESSWLGFKSLLPECRDDSFPDYLKNLRGEIKRTLELLPAQDDATKTTASVISDLQEIAHNWDSMGYLPWESVAKIAKIKPGKKSQSTVDVLIELASSHSEVSRFQTDIEELICSIFACAAECLSVYRDYKAERGLIDFVDQERLALTILQEPDIRPALDGRFNALLIDEFQDTSPIQLAVFLELAQLVQSSIWVGDEKQSIFGFRGSDPMLMQSVVKSLVPLTGGNRDNLIKSYRSRPALVTFVNEVFTRCLQPLGFDLNDIEIREANRSEDSSLNAALHLWWTGAGNQKTSVEAVADEVLDVLSHPEVWPVAINSIGGGVRNIRGSDIAILCRSNSRRLEIADALSQLGIIVSTERSGLLATPECVLAIAVLRFLNDSYDTLAIAEILRFTETSENDKSWLFDWLENGGQKIVTASNDLQSLIELRGELVGLTPVESLQLATTAPLVVSTLLRWGNQRQRLLNLDALVGVATTYEESCVTGRETASNAGLIAFLSSQEQAMQSANPDEQAVQVLTYHKAKGLEWPMVIMFDLDSAREANPFGVHIEKPKDGFDAHEPLLGRTIRYWPWPYGAQTAAIALTDTSAHSPEMQDVSSQLNAENLRLLYVGMTRPRDYLVLACRETGGGTAWLDIARDQKGESVFRLVPGTSGTLSILSNSSSALAVCKILRSRAQVNVSPAKLFYSEERYECLAANAVDFSPMSYSCAPSSLHLSSSASTNRVEVNKEIVLGCRLLFSKETDMRALGEALHQFFAIDDYAENDSVRLARALAISESHNVKGLSPESFIEASNRLYTALEELYPGAIWLREWSVTGRYGRQRMTGAIDLLLELSEGYVIIDHKSFPGPHHTWIEKAVGHYPQLDAYARLVCQATDKPVIACYIHMPIVGALLGLKASGPVASEQSMPLDEELWMVF